MWGFILVANHYRAHLLLIPNYIMPFIKYVNLHFFSFMTGTMFQTFIPNFKHRSMWHEKQFLITNIHVYKLSNKHTLFFYPSHLRTPNTPVSTMNRPVLYFNHIKLSFSFDNVEFLLIIFFVSLPIHFCLLVIPSQIITSALL